MPTVVTSSSPPLSDPTRAAEDALLLLSTGRAEMARGVLERLPGLIADALDSAATARARAAGEREVAALRDEARELEARLVRLRADREQAEAALARRRLKQERDAVATPARPRGPKRHELLAEALASGRVTAEEVARLLRVTPRNVEEIAGGRVGLARSTWRRVLALLEPAG